MVLVLVLVPAALPRGGGAGGDRGVGGGGGGCASGGDGGEGCGCSGGCLGGGGGWRRQRRWWCWWAAIANIAEIVLPDIIDSIRIVPSRSRRRKCKLNWFNLPTSSFEYMP